MSIQFKTRQFYPAEIRLLKTLRTRKEKETINKIKYYHFLVATCLGAGFMYLAYLINSGFFSFLFGTAAVFSFLFIVIMPYQIYNTQRKHVDFLKRLNDVIDRGTVDTWLVNAKRIAVAKEYEDEGDLFIIEYSTDKVVYLWDYDYNLSKKFPCLDFEIYEDDFFKTFGRQINPLSERIEPLIIDKKAKWNYMMKVGGPEQLQTEDKSFEKIIEGYNSHA